MTCLRRSDDADADHGVVAFASENSRGEIRCAHQTARDRRAQQGAGAAQGDNVLGLAGAAGIETVLLAHLADDLGVLAAGDESNHGGGEFAA